MIEEEQLCSPVRDVISNESEQTLIDGSLSKA
jgi:hypothetical protein